MIADAFPAPLQAGSLTDLVPAALGLCKGPEHVFSYANSRMRARAATPELVGRTFREAFPAQADGALHEALDRVFGSGEPAKVDQGMLLPSFDAQGAVDGVLLYLALGNTAAELDRRSLELDAREAAIAVRERHHLNYDEVLATLGHALRTPIHAMMGYGTLLRAELEPNPHAERILLKLLGGAEVLGQLVERMLDLHAIAEGTFELHPRPVDFGQMLERAVAERRDRAGLAGLRVTTEIARGLPVVYADERRVAQAVAALIDNALQFTPPGGTITVRAHTEDGSVACEIVDDGVGIEPGSLPDVFTPFKPLQPDWRRDGSGCGLGLPLGRAFVEAHGGRLWLESQRGRGTTGHISLPIAGPAGVAS